MSVGAERIKLGEDRKLIFQNYCNMVSKEQLAVAFSRSVDEVGREILFVAKKIREYRHRRCIRPAGSGTAEWRNNGGVVPGPLGVLPPVPCETEDEILMHSGVLLETLEYIGPETLSSELLIPTLTVHKVDQNNPAPDLREAAHALRSKLKEVR